MKVTILYVHDSTACWMQWHGRQLLRVHCESITRELLEQSSSDVAAIPSLCPWLTPQASRVRLLIDPVADQTRILPAFDHGFIEPQGWLQRCRHLVEQIYLTCRSLTSDVLADDLTRYRHDRLGKYPLALLQWHELKSPQRTTRENRVPRHWLVSDSGLPDYVMRWLSSMADHGLEFLDVSTVCSLFAAQDAHHSCAVVTIWSQPNRCRIIQTDSGFVRKVEQWNNTVEARIALEEIVAILIEEERPVLLRYIGKDDELYLWQQSVSSIEIHSRSDGLVDSACHSQSLGNVLPEACLNLPLDALIRRARCKRIGLWSNAPHWEAGSSLQELLSIFRWKRRYRQTVAAATTAASFAGYFVLLACMHAFELIDLHRRADAEIVSLHDRRVALEGVISNKTDYPERAVKAIEKLNAQEPASAAQEQVFLQFLAEEARLQPGILIHSVSWRLLAGLESEQTLLDAITEIDELKVSTSRLRASGPEEPAAERLLLISGGVAADEDAIESYQQSSQVLIAFMKALATHERVLEIVSLKDILSESPVLNLPSDVPWTRQQKRGFVLAVRVQA